MVAFIFGVRIVAAALWLILSVASLRRWGRKAVPWVLLSLPPVVGLAFVLPSALLIWWCTWPPGCMSAGL